MYYVVLVEHRGPVSFLTFLPGRIVCDDADPHDAAVDRCDDDGDGDDDNHGFCCAQDGGADGYGGDDVCVAVGFVVVGDGVCRIVRR